MVRKLVVMLFYPAVLLTSLVVTLIAIRSGQPPTITVMGVIFASAMPILVAQKWIPFEEKWRGKPRDFGIDLLHLGSTALATEGYRALTVGLFTAIAMSLQGMVGSTLWPSALPIGVQLVIALLLGDFGAYWVHRTCHNSPLLWRVHAMHHSSERLYVFASARNHPMNAVLAYGSQLLPLTLLGAPIEVIALLSVFTGVNGMLQHCNVQMSQGALNWILSTADLHRWHHSTDIDESNTNYGSNLVVWDIVFGTRNLPEGAPRALGLSGVVFPDNFLAHLASPFVLSRWEEAAWDDAEIVEAK